MAVEGHSYIVASRQRKRARQPALANELLLAPTWTDDDTYEEGVGGKIVQVALNDCRVS